MQLAQRTENQHITEFHPRIDGAGNKNWIINGAFQVWQRNTSFVSPTNGAFTADRWCIAYDGTGPAFTVSQQAFTAGSASNPQNNFVDPQFFCRVLQTAAGSGSTVHYFFQRIEDVRLFENQQVTVSFWAKADTNRTLSGFLTQSFGTGSPTGNVDTSLGSWALTTSWQRFVTTVTLPSILGATVNANSFVNLKFSLPLNVLNQQFDLYGVQVEAGPIATFLKQKSFAEELALCMRYYQKSFTYATVPTIGIRAGSIEWGLFKTGAVLTQTPFILLPVPMRTVPTVTLFNPVTAASFQVHNYTSGNDWTGSTASASNFIEKGFIIAGNSPGGTVGDVCGVSWTAEAEL
jgi:hypothetical protein